MPHSGVTTDSNSTSTPRSVSRPRRKFTAEEVDTITRKYGHMLHKVISVQLNDGMRNEYDSVDFLQMVWFSVFRRPDLVEGSDKDVANVLCRVAINKLNMERRRNLTKKRNRNRSVPLGQDVEGQTLSPEQYSMFRDQLDALFRALPTMCRELVCLRLQGYKMAEIVAELGASERSLRRAMNRVRETFRQQAAAACRADADEKEIVSLFEFDEPAERPHNDTGASDIAEGEPTDDSETTRVGTTRVGTRQEGTRQEGTRQESIGQ